MRQLDINKQTLFYANYESETPIYAYDEDGNMLTTNIEGVDTPVICGVRDGYTMPIEFEANISFNSGDTTLAEYGLNTGDYNAVISANKGELPFNERTIIWHTSEPKYGELGVLPESADYRVEAIKTSINEERFILKKRVDD